MTSKLMAAWMVVLPWPYDPFLLLNFNEQALTLHQCSHGSGPASKSRGTDWFTLLS